MLRKSIRFVFTYCCLCCLCIGLLVACKPSGQYEQDRASVVESIEVMQTATAKLGSRFSEIYAVTGAEDFSSYVEKILACQTVFDCLEYFVNASDRDKMERYTDQIFSTHLVGVDEENTNALNRAYEEAVEAFRSLQTLYYMVVYMDENIVDAFDLFKDKYKRTHANEIKAIMAYAKTSREFVGETIDLEKDFSDYDKTALSYQAGLEEQKRGIKN